MDKNCQNCNESDFLYSQEKENDTGIAPVNPMDLLHLKEEEGESQGPPDLSELQLKKGAAGARRSRKIVGHFLMLLGLCLMIGGGSLYYHNQLEDQQAGKASAMMLPEVRLEIQKKVSEEPLMLTEPTEHVNPYDQAAVDKANEMTVFVKNGWSYIGYLNIPALNLELPVLSEISDYNLGMAPCRHFGSTKSDDLVLAAHNYDFHFGRIRELGPGDEVSFIDMDGILSRYQVVVTDVIQPTDVEKVQDPALDLTLYTCTYGGENRVMVGCRRIP